ncbi:MAG: mechanosensitive ion channel [Bacteroidales bacterium]|nr:mechanosensitive ion channel [Bacteroidales bacterium]MDY4849762.1 mechanosensitive ion channel [Paludibacteraceae bacterium]MDY6036451.1 mechanosensitive ion channel [Paludibacteraceae bacterium]
MLLLQDITTPVILPADSLRQVTETIIQKVQEDPNAFWTQLLHNAITFGIKVVIALIIYIIGAWLIKRVKKLLLRIFERRDTERTLASFVSSLVSISMTVLLIIITVSTLGVDTTSLAALLAAGGMAIGMAMSGTVQNFAGGIMLLVFKPFKVGDFITAQGFSGTVTDVSIVSTKIVSTDNHIVVIPNGTLSNGNIDNYSTNPLRRVDLEISVAYGADADRCIETILDIVHGDKRIIDAQTPGAADPFVALSSLNASDITFVVRVWVHTPDYWNVRFDLNKSLYTQLPQQGFEFAYPHMDVTLIKN